ncbi:MAG: class I SAM-dependent methyltransferase [Cryomorphaceae bacterium]|nr:MAG: class I SAM-dependent methyltransferase [Cryomorphaceae bacterium]
MSFLQLRHYLNHHITARSKAGHGIHSPFVYKLATRVLPDQQAEIFNTAEGIRAHMLSRSESIQITDFGAGSRKTSTPERQIREIAKTSLQPAQRCRLLYRLAMHQAPGSILELGTSLGITTAYLAATQRPVFSMEGCPNIHSLACQNLKETESQNIHLLCGHFDELLPDFLREHSGCNFAFVDGNHRYDATIRYYELLKSHMPPNALMVFDDIYWSEGMKKAWKEIVSRQNQITIDLFYFGLVYLRPDQAPEHFKIKL